MDPITQGDLKAIEKKMHEIARRNLKVERVELDQTTLREHFESNPYKLEIIDDKLEAGDGSTIYKVIGTTFALDRTFRARRN